LISRSNKQQNEERFHAICLGDLIASDKLRKEGEKNIMKSKTEREVEFNFSPSA